MALSKGAHGTFGRVLGTFITPFYQHSGACHGEVISRQMTKPFKIEQTDCARGRVPIGLF
jgi:hypothetical protein